jgi:GDP-L-fucose synthase
MDAKRKGAKEVVIWGTGKPVREWGFVEDAAEGITLAMEKYDEIDVMNIGEGRGYTITQIAELIKGAAGWDGEFVYDSSKPDGAPKKILDVAKMKGVLGWQPKTDISTGISKTVQWYETNLD